MSDTIESGALTAIEPNALVATFTRTGAVDDLLERMKRDARARAAELDISTARGRAEIASLARTVIARAKTAWIAKGKELTEDWRKQTSAVNADCKKIEAVLDALRDEIRAPLTAWENAEKARVQGHEDALSAIEALSPVGGMSAHEISEHLALVPPIDARDWQEFRARADRVTTNTVNALKVALAETKAREEAEARAAAERAAEEARKAEEARIAAAEAQRIREERIAAEAAEAARLEAEARARVEAEKAERAARDVREAAERQARQEREAKERAEAAARKAEEDRIAAEQRAERERQEAAAKVEREKAAAVEAERKRLADEAAAAQAEADRRAANIAHRKRINGAALAALIEHAGVSEAAGKAVIEAIARQQIPAVSIRY
jgi:hypothetical protein